MGYHSLRAKDGKFRSKTPQAIVTGRLYGYKGIPVRAGSDRQHSLQGSDILRHVTCHKLLHGFVPEKDLVIIPKEKVAAYLQGA